jgi:hypothetical protein
MCAYPSSMRSGEGPFLIGRGWRAPYKRGAKALEFIYLAQLEARILNTGRSLRRQMRNLSLSSHILQLRHRLRVSQDGA